MFLSEVGKQEADQECHVFQGIWGKVCFFVEVKGLPTSLTCKEILSKKNTT